MVETLHTFDFDAVWEDLVEQFADPLFCLRELVQNAIDSNSGEVDIECEYRPADGDDAVEGRGIIHVRDFGEGMTREIIEGRLTELFHSGKDEDYTKIGRFGIGFVSVFGLEPSVVCLDTGRDGEYWRVLFDTDGHYELRELEWPVEGTHVRIVKPMGEEAFETMRERAGEVVAHWCKHARIPVRFEGEDVREPFEIDSPCVVTHREEGTRMAVGMVESVEPPYGYYNRGLTLEEGEEGPWKYVSFKVDSRYLEHTLTRDQVVEDEGFHEVREQIASLVTDELPATLLERLEAAAQPSQETRREGGDTLAPGHDRLAFLLSCYLHHHGEPPGDWRERPIVPTVGGEAIALDRAVAADEAGGLSIYTGDDPERVAALETEAVIVRAAGSGRGMTSLLRRHVDGQLPDLRSQYALPDIRPVTPDSPAAALFRAFDVLTGAIGRAIEPVGFAELYERSPLAETLVIAADSFDRPLSIDTLPAPTATNLDDLDRFVLNADHPLADRLAGAADREPEWVASILIKLMWGSALTARQDAKLAEAAIERRRERRGER